VVGIVIVAHSAQLAEAVQALAKQMLRQEVPLAAVGGVDDPENPFGTDTTKIHEAIKSLYSDDGVVVLMDIGSALLSAETALEFLTEEQRVKVRLCEAPLVEGAIAAAVSSEAGRNLEQVMDEARGALAAKASQLKADISEISIKTPRKTEAQSEEMCLPIRNRLGIHARPAARFVTTAAQYQSDITVRNITRNTGAVSAKSINLITTLGVRQGHEIAISAIGPDAKEALAALRALVESNLGEMEKDTAGLIEGKAAAKMMPAKGKIAGISAAPGIAIGPAVLYQPHVTEISQAKVDNPEAEWQRLQAAIAAVQREIRAMRTRISVNAGEYEAAIFDAHLLFLEDPALLEMAHRRIFEQKDNAEVSWQQVIDGMVESYQEIEDPYIRSRGADLADLKMQVLRLLVGSTLAPFMLAKPAILVATDLKPSDIARLDPSKVLGICTTSGGANSHSAILARALGIPAVVGVGPEVMRLIDGVQLVLDGKEGWVLINPDDIGPFQKRQEVWLLSQKAAREASQKLAVTADGLRIRVAANINSVAEVRHALNQGAEEIGLLRTEFLFMGRATPPSEEEQLTTYRSIAELLGKRPLIIRCLDAGGDKWLPYLNPEIEANPFLGKRGIRLYLEHPGIFKTQLRAILRASPGHQLKVLLPMVSSVQEVQSVKNLFNTVQTELKRVHIPFDESMEIGIMIEVPSAVVIADHLAKEADFFSIGSNDLSQYIMAADRTNARVASLSDALHPAVLRMIQQAVKAGHEAGIWVGLCGELAGDKLAAPVLLGLGIDELSMSPSAIPVIKQTISQLKMTNTKNIASEVLDLDSSEEVRQYIIKKHFL
jgi:phosphoenolpyruvate-protein phosphotransferase/dihydroxyacetone kinase phosphotransfer subunit